MTLDRIELARSNGWGIEVGPESWRKQGDTQALLESHADHPRLSLVDGQRLRR